MSSRKDLVQQLTSSRDGDPSINWGRLAVLAVGGVVTTLTVGVSRLLTNAVAGFEYAVSGIVDFLRDVIATLLGIPTAAFDAGFDAALAWLAPQGLVAGPVGLAIGLAALWLWGRLT
ncbi:hypothetical protein VB773_14220 [Haloarculaceae archaeon H-GB2-1]|nr:hypothetical protein [Haloarculaceae archaeon H-GB1-1]MEA5408611.1 hypothetical protein [Haloarculaceae archaeon H-GB2-1]